VGVEQFRAVDVGVAVHLAVAQENGVFEARDALKDTLLRRERHVVLEADEVVAAGALVLLAELD
jgi:hypothetical protein